MNLRTRRRAPRAMSVLLAVVLAASALLANSSCTPAARRALESVAATPYSRVSPSLHVRPSRSIAHSLVARINAERRYRHLRELRPNALLAKYAAQWARNLISTGQFRHQDLARIIVASDYRLAEVGENLFLGAGRGADDAGTAHITLMRSRTHRENILLPQAQLVGIAALCAGSKLMVVEEFGIRAGAPLPPRGQRVASVRPLIANNPGGPHC